MSLIPINFRRDLECFNWISEGVAERVKGEC